jgi:beta-lactam-binding protein with PASTA domain
VPEGSVIRTDPAAGSQVEQDTPINVVVSGGRAQIAVPSSIIGLSEAEARQVLENDPYGFTVTTVTEPSDSVQAGLVIRTDPAAGELVDRGGQVQLVVSDGPPGVTVPNVVGSTEAGAREQLAQFSVSVSVRDLPAGDPSDGLVISQSIAAGSVAPAGSTIELVIGRAAEPPPTAAPTTTRAPTTTAAPTTTRPPTTTTRPPRTTTTVPPTSAP